MLWSKTRITWHDWGRGNKAKYIFFQCLLKLSDPKAARTQKKTPHAPTYLSHTSISYFFIFSEISIKWLSEMMICEKEKFVIKKRNYFCFQTVCTKPLKSSFSFFKELFSGFYWTKKNPFVKLNTPPPSFLLLNGIVFFLFNKTKNNTFQICTNSFP